MIKKYAIAASAAAVVLSVSAFAGMSVFATAPSQTELSSNNWRVYNAMPATAKFWDINRAQPINGGGGSVPNPTV